MLNVLKPLSVLLKLDNVCIDNNIFRLHYKVSVIILLVSSLLVTSKQYFGDPIDCITSVKLPREVINTYCWIFSTYTVKKLLNGTAGKDVAYAGVGPSVNEVDEVIHHKYYQWVCIVLTFQALLFYVPRYMWKTWEGGRVRMLVQDLTTPIILNDKWNKDRRSLLSHYLLDVNKSTHVFYMLRFSMCEALNFINVVGQIFLVDFFLGAEFSGYGPAVAAFLNQPISVNDIDPTVKLFPKVAKCDFTDYGPSGTVQRKDALCVLPLNIVNEKIYAFLWFWFVALAFISGLVLIYRALVMICPELRVWILMSQTYNVPRKTIRALVRAGHAGDWFVLQQVCKNLNPDVFRDLLLDIGHEIESQVI